MRIRSCTLGPRFLMKFLLVLLAHGTIGQIIIKQSDYTARRTCGPVHRQHRLIVVQIEVSNCVEMFEL